MEGNKQRCKKGDNRFN